MEGIAYEYAYYLSAFRALYPDTAFRKLSVVGGGAKSELFNRIKADVLGLPVIPLETVDAAPVGAAVIAGVGVGLFSDYHAPIMKTVKRNKEISADTARHHAYRPYADAYLKTLGVVGGIYDAPIWKP
jgi:xylulokinase